MRVLCVHPIPGDCWRRIINFCGADASFCHLIAPWFQDNGMVVMLLCEGGERFVQERNTDEYVR